MGYAFAMRWWLVLSLVGACHRTEYIDVPRAGGGTVRVVKAREPLMKKLDVSFDRYPARCGTVVTKATAPATWSTVRSLAARCSNATRRPI